MSIIVDTKSDKIIRKTINVIASYLEADPNKPINIYTVNRKDRNDQNGWANFCLRYITLTGYPDRKYIRLETNTFGDKIFIKPTKIKHIKNVDLLIMYNELSDSVYIADRTINNNNLWLEDKSIRNFENNQVGNKIVSYYVYKIESVMSSFGFIECIKDNNQLHIAAGPFMLYWKQQVIKGKWSVKNFYSYNNVNFLYKYIQYDSKDRDTIYYCFASEKQASKVATLLGLAEFLSAHSNLDQNSIYQRLYRAMKKETYVSIPCNDLNIDKRFLDANGDIKLGLSNTIDTYITEKINKTKDRKVYKKVLKYKKTHSKPKDSWTDEEKDLFYKI